MKSKPGNKIIRIAIVFALVSVILYFSGLFMVLREIKKVENVYSDTESEFSKNRKFLAIKSAAENNPGTIQDLRGFFIKKGDEVKFIEQIEEVARDSGIEYNIITISIKPNQTGFKEDVEVRINVEGSWGNVISFIDKLEKMPFGVSVEDISLDTLSEEWSGFVRFVVFREK